MYGLVNKAIEGLVVENYGDNVREEIKAKAKIDIDVFISNEAYEDQITYDLVGAASEVLNAPAETILENFGIYWVTKIAEQSYGHMMDAGGKSLTEFLVNLPNFHTRVTMIFPKLQPPRFEVSDVGENQLKLHYHSHRSGLQHFVIGLMKGLGQRFKMDVRVTLTESISQDPVHDVFLVQWQSTGN